MVGLGGEETESEAAHRLALRDEWSSGVGEESELLLVPIEKMPDPGNQNEAEIIFYARACLVNF